MANNDFMGLSSGSVRHHALCVSQVTDNTAIMSVLDGSTGKN